MWSKIVTFIEAVLFPGAMRLALGLTSRQPGQSMVEYAIIAALIAVACLAGVQALGTGISGVFSRILGSISGIG